MRRVVNFQVTLAVHVGSWLWDASKGSGSKSSFTAAFVFLSWVLSLATFPKNKKQVFRKKKKTHIHHWSFIYQVLSLRIASGIISIYGTWLLNFCLAKVDRSMWSKNSKNIQTGGGQESINYTLVSFTNATSANLQDKPYPSIATIPWFEVLKTVGRTT